MEKNSPKARGKLFPPINNGNRNSPERSKQKFFALEMQQSPESKLPAYSQAYSSPPIAAGVPVLELIRKLEDEKMLSKNDRLQLNIVLNDALRKDGCVRILRDIELGSNPKFALKRLKMFIYQHGSGEPNSKMQNAVKTISSLKPSISIETSSVNLEEQYSSTNQNNQANKESEDKDDDKSVAMSVQSMISDTRSTLSKVVGNSPVYAGPGHAHVCMKIGRRLRDFLIKYDPSKMGVRRFAVIVGSGSCNPLTRMHLRTYFLAKQYLESRSDMVVLGSLLAPAHISVVRKRYRTCQSEILPCPHRLAIAQLCVQDSKWLSIDPWEITRRRAMDYLSVMEHSAEMLKSCFPNIDIKVVYLCKPNMVPLLSSAAFKTGNYGCVTVCRAPESDWVRNDLGQRWNGILLVAEDSAILDASMDSVSSRKVRDRLKKLQSVEHLVGDTIAEYFKVHKIGEKMIGEFLHFTFLKLSYEIYDSCQFLQ